MKIGCIIQARTSSTRLPEKVLKALPYNSDTTVLQQVIRRVKKASLINEIVVATTTDREDEKIMAIAEKEHVWWFRGSKDNVLERFFFAAKEYKFDHIIRVTSDCPCIDPIYIDLVVKEHISNGADYTSNSLVRTFPHGMDTEAFSFYSLEKAYHEAREDFEIEHVTPFIYKSHPDKFKIKSIIAPDGDASDIRVTLDTREDYILLSAVYGLLYDKDNFFGSAEIVKLFNLFPWLREINNQVLQKKLFDNYSEEQEEAIKVLHLQGLGRVADFLMKNDGKV